MGLLAKDCEQIKARPLLKKHAATIHCSNALSLLQRKISNAFLYHAYHELREKNEHEITVRELCNIIGYNGHNHAAIKEAIKGLISTVLEWNVIDERTGEEEWNASSILASVQIKGAQCRYSYSHHLKQLLYTPSVYGKINMLVQARFKSSYGLALYENCVRYYGLPFTKWFEMTIFRKLMGIPDDKYPIFRDLKRRVLDKAIDEVNTYSDLIVELQLQRSGRKVIRLRFSLKDRPKKIHFGIKKMSPSIQDSEENDKNHTLGQMNNCDEDLVKELIQDWNLNIQQIQNWIKKYGEHKIRNKIAYVKSTTAFQNNSIRQLGGYLQKALENNYEDNSSHLSKNETLQNLKVQKNLRKQYHLPYQQFVQNYILQQYGLLEDQKKIQIEKDFLEKYKTEVSGMVIVNTYLKYGLDAVHEEFTRFLAIKYSSLQMGLLSLDQYIQLEQNSMCKDKDLN